MSICFGRVTQMDGYPALGPTLVSTVSTPSFHIPNSTLPLKDKVTVRQVMSRSR